MDDQVEGLENKLGRVMESHEYQYMQAYNMQVKRKEKELLDLLDKMNSDDAKD